MFLNRLENRKSTVLVKEQNFDNPNKCHKWRQDLWITKIKTLLEMKFIISKKGTIIKSHCIHMRIDIIILRCKEL